MRIGVLAAAAGTTAKTDLDACSGGICTILDPPGPETRGETGQPGCCPAAG